MLNPCRASLKHALVQGVKKWMSSDMYLSIQQDICDIYDQNNMTEINLFAIYAWQKQSVYGTCQEIILPTTWKKIPSGWVTPEIILLNDLKTPQKWRLAFPGPLTVMIVNWPWLSRIRDSYRCHRGSFRAVACIPWAASLPVERHNPAAPTTQTGNSTVSQPVLMVIFLEKSFFFKGKS